MKFRLMDRVEDIKEIKKIQGTDGNWNFSEYQKGLYNGIELALCIIEEREPEYKVDEVMDRKEYDSKSMRLDLAMKRAEVECQRKQAKLIDAQRREIESRFVGTDEDEQ